MYEVGTWSERHVRHYGVQALQVCILNSIVIIPNKLLANPESKKSYLRCHDNYPT